MWSIHIMCIRLLGLLQQGTTNWAAEAEIYHLTLLEARVQGQSCGRTDTFWHLGRRICACLLASGGLLAISGVSLGCTSVTLISLSLCGHMVFILCACLCVQMSPCYKDIDHTGIWTRLLHTTSTWLIISAMILLLLLLLSRFSCVWLCATP